MLKDSPGSIYNRIYTEVATLYYHDVCVGMLAGTGGSIIINNNNNNNYGCGTCAFPPFPSINPSNPLSHPANPNPLQR